VARRLRGVEHARRRPAGYADRAKELLREANEEIKLAAETANANLR